MAGHRLRRVRLRAEQPRHIGISELIAITATLFEERKRVRRLLNELPESFGEVRKRLNELSRTLR